MKWMSIARFTLFTFLLTQAVSSNAAGLFFDVSANGIPASVPITLCLNGEGPSSCQNYTVSRLTLSILTTIPNHTYPIAGIKVNTPGYSPSHCTYASSGYCLFSASNTTPANITLTPSSSQKNNQTITFTTTAPSATVGGPTYIPTATSTSGLPVTITVDSSSSSVCSISAGIVSFVAVGTCTLDANQSGDADYNAAAQVQQNVAVYIATPTTTMVYSSVNPSETSAPVTLSANVSSDNGVPSGGTVGFTANGSNISGCTARPLSSGIATCTTSSLSTGTSAIVATYTGGSGFAGSTSQASFSQSVVGAVTATVPAPPQDVTATPGNGQVTVNWYPPSNTGGGVITGYTVQYGTTASATFTTFGCTTTSDLSCVISGLTNEMPYTFTAVASNSNGTGPTAFSSSVTPKAVLTPSATNLALSALGSGASRTVTITNTSLSAVTLTSVSAPSPDLPSGTTVDTSQVNACASDVELTANGGSCTLTITPGSNATSACTTTGTSPTPSVITVTDNNSDTATVNIVVLGSGCQYQQGYLFSIDDTTPTTSSIGGKVMTLSDQGTSMWTGAADSIWGIDDNSTIGIPSPNASSGQPATLLPGQLNCDAINDGSCATNNAFVFYGTGGSYAAGLCKTVIDSYTDWYLPSVCELGPFGSGGTYPLGASSQTCTTGSSNVQNQLVDTNIVSFNHFYWSSTEASSSPLDYAWYQFLTSVPDANGQAILAKNANEYVRCVRALTS